VGDVVADAHVGVSPDGKPVVEFNLTPEGRQQFVALRRANIGRRLALVVNGTVVASPTVMEAMVEGKEWISGNYTERECSVLAAQMISPKLPATP
jgi:preprotein translocase subunit SecD